MEKAVRGGLKTEAAARTGALRKWMGRLAADAGGVRIVWAEWRAARAGGQLGGACRRDDTPRGRVDISRRKGLGADA